MSDVALALYVMIGVHLFEYFHGLYIGNRRHASQLQRNRDHFDNVFNAGKSKGKHDLILEVWEKEKMEFVRKKAWGVESFESCLESVVKKRERAEKNG